MSEDTTTNLETEQVVTEEAATETKDPVAALTEDLQRLQAEYSNYRKRVERDRALAAEVAISSVLLEFLAVLDDLDRAASHNELSGGFKAVADQIIATTAKLGLEKYGEAPAAFDPNIHDALMHETSNEVKETTVTKVLQPGYKYKERVLRPARVVVSDPE
jgi:molecular chaperone GrpE